MPQQRRSPPRRRDRRSRSRSHSPRRRRRSHSRSRSRDRRHSRSPPRKRSPERRHRSPLRKRSPSPKRHMKSRSRSPKRRTHYSSSPSDRGYPVKRPADSSGKRQGYRSRSPSPVVQKRSRDERRYKEDSPRDTHRSRRSHSPSDYGGKMYSDQPSSSKQPIFPAGSSRGKAEIDYVTIVEKGPKREKLNKRFETLEQVAQGPFDFEENITIGIHRGPQHLHLHDDEDIEVNYAFNPKTFKMLFPKKEYVKAIFDRDEIKAFHHDDILDEEAYVEKRTISIKPVNKPKAKKYGDEFDYKITVGSDRDGYGDRRMVHDSGSRSRSSRSSGYNDIPVTVRLDPKPDPRYEKLFKEQQRSEDQALIQEKIQRNPNDLRYNLMRRKSDGDRGDRQHDPVAQGAIDARSRIMARRESQGNNRRDRSAPERRSPPREDDRHRRGGRTDLPDFKNRPGKKLDRPRVWVIGSSVVKDIVKFGEKYPEYDLAERLKDDVESIEIHGENDMNIEDILAGVRFMLKKKELPQMIVFHCGEQDICAHKNVDLVEIMDRDLKIIRQEIPDVLLVFSQILPAWHRERHTGSTLGKSRRRINRFMRQCFVNDEINGAFLYHPRFRTDKSHFHMPTRDQCLHLNKMGMEVYLYELITGIRYFISGHGSIFPYMKWPMSEAEIKSFEPFCMCMLNLEQIKSLTVKTFSLFSEQQIKSLTNEQINMFSRKQCKYIFDEKILSILSQSQLKGLEKRLFMNLSENTLKLFSDDSERMDCLNEDTRAYIVERLAKFEGQKKNDKTKKLEQTIGDLINISDDSDVEIIDSDVESVIESTEDNWAREYVGAIQPSEMQNTGRSRKSCYALRGRDTGRAQEQYSYRNIGIDGLKARGITRFSNENKGTYNDRDRHSSDDYKQRYGRNGSEEGDRQKYYERASRRNSRDRHSRNSRSYSSDRYSSGSQSRSRSRDRYESDDSSEREWRSREHRHRRSSSSKDRQHGYSHQGPSGLETRPQPFCPPYNPSMLPSGPPMMPMMFNPAVPPGVAPPMPFPVTPFGPFPPAMGTWPPAAPQVAPVASKPKVKNWGDFPPENDSFVSVNTSNLKQLPNPIFNVQNLKFLSPHYLEPSRQPESSWGHCSVCNISLGSEEEAMDHVESVQHHSNEAAFGMAQSQQDGGRAQQNQGVPFGKQNIRGRGSGKRKFAEIDDDVHGIDDDDDERNRGAAKKKLKPEPEWKINPTVTPKGQSYFEHDNRMREDMTFWERKQMFLKTGRYPPSGPRGRGGFRGRGGRGRERFGPKKSFGETMDVWKHDKFDEEDDNNDKTEQKNVKEKVSDKRDKKVDSKEKGKSSRRVSSNEKKRNEHKESSSHRKSHEVTERERKVIRDEEDSLKGELKVEVT